MLNAGVGELLLDEAEAVLVRRCQDDGVRLRRRRARFARSVDELRADVAQGHVRADEDVVSEGVLRRGAKAEVNDGWS